MKKLKQHTKGNNKKNKKKNIKAYNKSSVCLELQPTYRHDKPLNNFEYCADYFSNYICSSEVKLYICLYIDVNNSIYLLFF